MLGKWNRRWTWLMMLASGGMVFQATGCDTFFNVVWTGLLATLTGTTLFLARNI